MSSPPFCLYLSPHIHHHPFCSERNSTLNYPTTSTVLLCCDEHPSKNCPPCFSYVSTKLWLQSRPRSTPAQMPSFCSIYWHFSSFFDSQAQSCIYACVWAVLRSMVGEPGHHTLASLFSALLKPVVTLFFAKTVLEKRLWLPQYMQLILWRCSLCSPSSRSVHTRLNPWRYTS